MFSFYQGTSNFWEATETQNAPVLFHSSQVRLKMIHEIEKIGFIGI